MKKKEKVAKPRGIKKAFTIPEDDGEFERDWKAFWGEKADAGATAKEKRVEL